MADDSLILAGREFRSRLIVGTGKYPSLEVMEEAHAASGAEMVTVAVRRVDLKARGPENLLDHIDTRRLFILPNTAACYTADEAVRTARLGREAGLSNWVKLEVIGDEKTLYPDTEALLAATRTLVQGRLHRPALHHRRRGGGAQAGGRGRGGGDAAGRAHRQRPRDPEPDQHPARARGVRVPVIVDAGVGTASDAALAMELGADGVLMNTAIALAREPVRMARAMKAAVEAGREAFRAGRIPRKMYASASSPVEGVVGR